MIVASKSTSAGDHTVQKISLVDNLNLETIAIHNRPIRDIQCAKSGLCLTTGLDGKAKITSLKDNCIVQRYQSSICLASYLSVMIYNSILHYSY
jgi:hypothetical protein